MTRPEDISFKNPYIIWFHKMDSNDWSENSYYKLGTINNYEEFFNVFNNFPNPNQGMFLLMKKNIIPCWEDDSNKHGGVWSYKINYDSNNPQTVIDIWKNMCTSFIGNTLTQYYLNDDINGISIAPKQYSFIIKIWNKNEHLEKFHKFQINGISMDKFLNLKKSIYRANSE